MHAGNPFDVGTMFRLLAEQAGDLAVLFVDPEGRVRYANPTAGVLFGYPDRGLEGLEFERLFTPEDVAIGAHRLEQQVALAGQPAEDDRWQKRADGTRFFATGLLVALHEQGRLVGFAKVLRNRTDLKVQLEGLRATAARLENAARSREIFISTLSHELRNPLAPLANAAHILRVAAPGSPEQSYGIQVIERQVALLERLVGDLLDLSRVSAGKVDLRRRMVAVQDVLRGAIEATSPIVSERSHRLDVVMPEADLEVDADPDRLHQVFVNLLTNAAKYTPPGGRIWVSVTAEGEEAVVRVIDNGAGIPTDMLPRIFDLFTQVESTRPDSRGGLGIGLSLVRDLVALHGGSVQARSDGAGRGSEFVVRLPLPSRLRTP